MLLIGAAAVSNPVLLEGIVFRSGETLDSPRWVVALWTLSVALGAGALLVGVLALHVRSTTACTVSRRLTFTGIVTVWLSAFALLAGEVYCRLALDLGFIVPVESSLWWEHRWRQSHAPRPGALSPAAFTALNRGYTFDVHHPLLGWTPRPGASREGITINGAGFRDAREHPIAKPPGVSRIVAIGDSFTFGEGVIDDETYCAILETLLPETPVLNFGVHGYGVDQQYLRLKHDAIQYEPDLVVLGLFLPDAERNLLTFRDYAKPRFELRNGKLVLTNVPVPPPAEVLAGRISKDRLPSSYLMSMVGGHLARVWRKTRLSQPESLGLLPSLLDAILIESRRGEAKLLLVIIPPGFGAWASTERLCLRWAQDNDVPVANIADLFRRMSESEKRRMYHVRGDGHYSADGHRVIAREIARVIRERKLVPFTRSN